MRILRIAFVLWLLLAAQAMAAVDALDYTRATLERAGAIVAGSQTHNEKLAALSALFRRFLDTDAIGQAVLGPHWSSLTPAQQKEFLPLFRRLFERSFVSKLLLFEQPRFAYVGETPIQGGESRVDTKIVTPRDEFAVTYVLRPRDQEWQATDVVVEDVSLTKNLANQFNRVISRSSIEDMLELLRRKYGPEVKREEGS
jgi:phospholipid transport system substrate-binding protein